MANGRLITVRYADIQDQYKVRNSLNPDRLEFLRRQFEAGNEMEPIKVAKLRGGDGTLFYRDGRHRGHIYRSHDVKEGPAHLHIYDSATELLIDAFLDNMGGPQPPTEGELEEFVMKLRDISKMSEGEIAQRLSLTVKTIRTIVRNKMSTRNKQREAAALNAVQSESMSVEQAAKAFNLKPAGLKALIDKKQQKRAQFGERKGAMQTMTHKFGKRLTDFGRTILEEVKAGEVPRADAIRYFRVLRSAANGWADYCEDCAQRAARGMSAIEGRRTAGTALNYAKAKRRIKAREAKVS